MPAHPSYFRMNSLLRPALAVLLGTSAALLTACDYKYSPGVNTQFEHGFNGQPGYTNADVNRDSINYQQNVHTPIGKGSATDIQSSGTDGQLQNAPAGKSASSPQSANGKLDAVGSSSPTNHDNTPQAAGAAPQ